MSMKRFHGVLAGNVHECSLIISIGKARVMRQKLASVVLGLPSVALSRINGFSPVKRTALGSTVGMTNSFWVVYQENL